MFDQDECVTHGGRCGYVSARADLTAVFFGSLRRARELVERAAVTRARQPRELPPDFRARERTGPTRPVLFCCGALEGPPFRKPCDPAQAASKASPDCLQGFGSKRCVIDELAAPNRRVLIFLTADLLLPPIGCLVWAEERQQ